MNASGAMNQPSVGGPEGPPPREAIAASDAEIEQQLFARIAWRLMPVIIAAYVLNYLDRNNVGFAGLTMNKDLGLTATQFGIGGGIFFVGYCFFELPSNLVLYRVGARVWLARIMITWGLISAATIFVTGPWSFFTMRLLLGAAEAGFFPGVAFYLARWFPAEHRTRAIAWLMTAVPVSSVVAGPLSSLLLQMDGVWGLVGWKWLFLLEGLPAVIVGVVALRTLTERPEDAAWLSDAERRIIARRLEAERKPREVHGLVAALTDVRVLVLAGVQFGFLVGSYGAGLWLPQILKAGQLTNTEVGLVSSAPYVLATVALVAWGGRVARRGHAVLNLTIACAVSAAGFVLAVAFADRFWVSVAWITIAIVGINGARGLFWSIPPRFLTGIAAAGGLAFINSIGTMGGFVGPTVMGWLTDETGSYSAGLIAMGGFLLIAAMLSWSLRVFAHTD
jgi:sugar phosphate permease